MNPSSPAPLVFFQVLADRSGRPSGLMFDFGGAACDVGAVLALVGGEAFQALGEQLPCFHRGALAPELADALQQARWQPIDGASLFRTDALVKDALPPQASWIEGDWCLAAPPKARGAQAASRALALHLVQLVAADADTHAIEALLRRDPTLSYHLLRLVNSLGVGAGRRITSFSQALLILGRQQLRRWLNLMLFAARQGDPRSAMLLARVALRARALELLAKARGLDKTTQEQGFMTGMFSLLGVLFGMELTQVLAPLAIGTAVQDALLKHAGELGELLRLIETAESGDLGGAAAQLQAMQLAPAQFNAALVEACSWMLGALRENQGQVA